MKRIAVLISGSGTNLQAVLDGCAEGRIPGQVVGVLSNRAKAYGLVRAEQAGVETHVERLKPWRDAGRTRQEYDRALAEIVAGWRPDLVVLAGWMHVLSPAFLDRFPGRVINLHPALPGELPGVNAIERAYQQAAQGLRQRTGVMVHQVVPEVDAGPVLGTEEVTIVPGEPLESLAERIHVAEHRLLVSVVAQLLSSTD